jgi:drug/metabolite transporter (DMT)-like permease
MISNKAKGYITAGISTITLANVYIFSKAALNETNIYQFGFYWFGFAIVWNIIYSFFTGHFKTVKHPSVFQYLNFLGIGIIEVIATTAIFIGIKIIPNPSIPAFIRNIEPVLIVLLAVVFLNEKYGKVQVAGIILTILGTFIISYNKGTTLQSVFIPGVQYIIISSFFYSIRTVWSKKVIRHFTALSLNLNKIAFLFVLAFVFMLISKSSFVISQKAFFNILVGSLIGPFFTSFLQFLSLKYIDASRSTLVQSLTGFITVVLAYFYFGTFPYLYQIAGGAITILGLIFVVKPPKPPK